MSPSPSPSSPSPLAGLGMSRSGVRFRGMRFDRVAQIVESKWKKTFVVFLTSRIQSHSATSLISGLPASDSAIVQLAPAQSTSLVDYLRIIIQVECVIQQLHVPLIPPSRHHSVSSCATRRHSHLADTRTLHLPLESLPRPSLHLHIRRRAPEQASTWAARRLACRIRSNRPTHKHRLSRVRKAPEILLYTARQRTTAYRCNRRSRRLDRH